MRRRGGEREAGETQENEKVERRVWKKLEGCYDGRKSRG